MTVIKSKKIATFLIVTHKMKYSIVDNSLCFDISESRLNELLEEYKGSNESKLMNTFIKLSKICPKRL